ncbi:MAG: ribosome biogenesis GTP-binding protein YihA/YsxC [Clostridia bacterium]
MIIKNSAFITSAGAPKDRIVSDTVQIAVVGKSNVGKSSFINFLTNDGKLARTSKAPGRTRLINYFLINDGNFILTDLPGYGFAKVCQEEKEKWAILIDDYLEKEESLAHVFFLLDLRHDPTDEDMTMYNYLFKNAIPFTVIATKADKIPKSKIRNQIKHFATLIKLGVDNVIPVSNVTKIGKEEVLSKIDGIIAAFKEHAEFQRAEDEAEDIAEKEYLNSDEFIANAQKEAELTNKNEKERIEKLDKITKNNDSNKVNKSNRVYTDAKRRNGNKNNKDNRFIDKKKDLYNHKIENVNKKPIKKP